VETIVNKLSFGLPERRLVISLYDLLSLGIVLLIAAVLRLAHPLNVIYSQDQADLSTLALDLVEGKSFPLLGIPSSARFPNSPMTVYVVAIPYFISKDPVFVEGFIAIMNVIGVGLVWYLAWRYFNPRVALLAGLAYAINPWAVGYSHDIWAQSYHTPIFLGGLLLGLLGFIDGRRWAQVLCLPVLTIAMQIHFAAWLYLPMYLWLVWVGRARVSKKALIASGLLALLTLLPYLLGVVQAYLSENEMIAGVQTLQREVSLREIIKPSGYMFWLSTGLSRDFLIALGVPVFHWVLLGGFTLLGIVAFLQLKERWLTVFVFLWAFLHVVFLSLPLISVAPHYFVPTIPALSLLAALGIDWLLRQTSGRFPLAQPLIMVSLASVFITQAVYIVRAGDHISSTYSPAAGGGPPLHYLYPVQEALRQYEDVVLINSGDWIDLSRHGSAVWSSLLRETAVCTRELLVSQNFALIPDGTFAAVFTPGTPTNSLFDDMYRVGSPATFALRPGEDSYEIYAVSQPPVWNGALTDIDPALFENGVELNAYTLQPDRVVLSWQLPAAPSSNYSYQVAFLDSEGEVIEQHWNAFWPRNNWCEDDQLISWLDVAPPRSTATMQIRMFGFRGNEIGLANTDNNGAMPAVVQVSISD
jgi:hypothetical protein